MAQGHAKRRIPTEHGGGRGQNRRGRPATSRARIWFLQHGAQGIATATNHHVDYTRLGMTPPPDGRMVEQSDNLYERAVALGGQAILECTNTQLPRDP